MIASPTDTDPARTTLADNALPIPAHFPHDWPHHLVVDMLKPGLDFRALAAHIGVSFTALAELINSPQVQAETNALNDLTQTRARLLALSAGPRSISKLITIVDAPLPHNTGMTPEAESRAWCRHADLAIRAINALTRHTRPSPPPNNSGPKHTSPDNTKPDNTPKNQPPAPSNPAPSPTAPSPSAPDSPTPTSDPADQRAAVAKVPSAAAQCGGGGKPAPGMSPPAAASPRPNRASVVEQAGRPRLSSSFPDDPSAFNATTGASDTESSEPTESSSSPLPIAHSPLPSSQHSSAAPRPGESSIRVEPSSESHYTRHARDRPAA
ncbi:MAG: hypothetical protein KF838_11120 [Phycisphaeraceae bacterium]|nr:MAG: hypothetical protein KF838_11120 [Phycisphaeraceae bacterium]